MIVTIRKLTLKFYFKLLKYFVLKEFPTAKIRSHFKLPNNAQLYSNKSEITTTAEQGMETKLLISTCEDDFTNREFLN